MGTQAHVPVLLSQSVALLQPGPGKTLLDGTAGGGGHAQALAEMGARVIALDRDPAAVRATRERLGAFADRCTVIQENFGKAAEVAEALGLAGFDGALLDLGVSSPQIDRAERGFSFQGAGPLDMRMEGRGETAAELLHRLDEKELAELLRELGEEPFARRIARSIKQAQRMERTEDLSEAVKRAVPRRSWPRRIHVATRTFQAIRMAVNQELEALSAFLQSLPGLLRPLGRAVIISFHSLEDRQVKRAFAALAGACRCPPRMPVCVCGAGATFRVLTRKAIQADVAEIERNPRARSARLRAVEKLKEAA